MQLVVFFFFGGGGGGGEISKIFLFNQIEHISSRQHSNLY